jgi:hypothetical protein
MVWVYVLKLKYIHENKYYFLIANLIIYKKEKKNDIPNKIHKSDYNKY